MKTVTHVTKTFKHSKFTATFTTKHNYCSFTGTCDGSSGAVGHKIAEIYPDFAPLEAVHLCDAKTGEPLHALANAEYWLKKGRKNAAKRALHLEGKDRLFNRWAGETLHLWEQLEQVRNIKGYESRVINPIANELGETIQEIREVWADTLETALDLVDDTESNLVGGYVFPFDEYDEPINQEYGDHLDGFDEEFRVIALARYLDLDILEIDTAYGDETMLSGAGGEYLVVEDHEADELWDQELDNYIDDCLEIPEGFEPYFDREAWKKDARMDGRGHSLGRYDGHEYAETFGKRTWFIYRQN